MFDWIDAKWGELISTLLIGSAVGSLWRTITSPKDSLVDVFKQVFLAMTVGVVLGGALAEYLELSRSVSVGVGAISAFLGEHALDFLGERGKKLQEGKIDVSLTGGDK